MTKYDDIIRDMRQRCRLAMDGIKSDSMRMRGLKYKLNFGLVIQQIKDIAARYEADAKLAERLWKEETRELIIMATLLYPADQLTADKATQWAGEIPNQEIREQVCVNLFKELLFADQLAVKWANDADEAMRTTGYWLLARLLLAKLYEGVLKTECLDTVWADIISENIFLKNASLLVLKHIGRQSKENADKILSKIAAYQSDTNSAKRETYDSLAFEFEFIWN